MKLTLYESRFAVCRLDPHDPVPDWADGALLSITRTPRELSIICAESAVPEGVRVEIGFRAMEVLGPLDFSAVGILASLAKPLAEAGISILAVATFDTDVVLVREGDLEKAVAALGAVGWGVG
ncbi:MAG TPA: ACT domain-containing protein [Thermoanaerobaculia bacterium]|nr:ACT domain-containing protein [Thermoanaerobaculia bacterium]